MSLPQSSHFDETIALLREGYRFGRHRFERLGTDLFKTRLMARRAYFARGSEAAREFYTPDRFTRRGALPPTALLLLQDRGSVATLDGAAHRRRKALFMDLMHPSAIQRLGDLFEQCWCDRATQWERRHEIELHREAQEVLCRAVCTWVGIDLSEAEARRRTTELAAMIHGAGAIGPRNWRALLLRRRTERWAQRQIRAARRKERPISAELPLARLAAHREEDGSALSEKLAGVELLNLLRPTVAVARYIVFTALALHEHPATRPDAAEEQREPLLRFVQEVRRYYPFFPVVGGRARETFTWRDHSFPKGSWMILDLYATHFDPNEWDEPESFQPERFTGREENPRGLLPQGGGEYRENHRCAGEWITLDLMQRALRLLLGMRYTVPPQDLSVPLGRMPTRPRSGFRMTHIEAGGSAVGPIE